MLGTRCGCCGIRSRGCFSVCDLDCSEPVRVGVLTVSQHGRSALHCAASNGNVAVVQLLVSRGADVKIRNKVIAATTGRDCSVPTWRCSASLTVLVQAGATPLHTAAWLGLHNIAHALVRLGASVDDVDAVCGDVL